MFKDTYRSRLCSLHIMCKSILLLLVLSTFLPKSMAQTGSGFCSCSPGSYEFTLDFSLSCGNNNVASGGNTGISRITCFSSGSSFNTVTEIQAVESNLNGVFSRSQVAGPFVNGGKYTYNSQASINSNFENQDLPFILQLNVFGRNSANQAINIVWILEFTNSCSIFPVLETGGTTLQLGVTKLVRSQN